MEAKNALTEQQKQILEDDLNYLTDMAIHNNGKTKFLGTKEKPYNIGLTLKESEFVRKWLLQFALGNETGINYFNSVEWCELTNKGRYCAQIVADDNEDKTVLIIPPVTSNGLTPRDYTMLRTAVRVMNSNIADEKNSRIKDSNLPLAKEVVKLMEAKRVSLTDLIPEAFYAKWELVPLVEQQCMFIRDVVNADTKHSNEDLYRLRDILIAKHKEEPVSREDREFVNKISRNTVDWGEDEEAVENNHSQNNSNYESDEDDPLSC